MERLHKELLGDLFRKIGMPVPDCRQQEVMVVIVWLESLEALVH